MKKALVALVVLLAVAAGGAWWAYHELGFLVKLAVEHYGPQVAGASVKLGEVKISASDGRGLAKDLVIGNPPGFDAPRAVRVGRIRVALDPRTLTQPVVRIHELGVEDALVTYANGDRGTNLEAIQKNIQGYIERSGGPSQGRPAQAQPGKRKFIVERLSIRGTKVTMTNPGLRGQGVGFDLPDIELRDLGARQEGLTASEIGNVVAGELQARIAQKVLTRVELLRKGGVGGALDALKGLLR